MAAEVLYSLQSILLYSDETMCMQQYSTTYMCMKWHSATAQLKKKKKKIKV